MLDKRGDVPLLRQELCVLNTQLIKGWGISEFSQGAPLGVLGTVKVDYIPTIYCV